MRVRLSFTVLLMVLPAASSTAIGHLDSLQQNQLSSEQETPSQTRNLQTVQLPPGLTSCTPVSVKGDATYCIEGRVCSRVGSNLPGTNCPKKGDLAISQCRRTLKSYNAANGSCVATQDTQCMVIETGVWGCAYPDVTPLTTAVNGEVASEAAGSLSSTSVSHEIVLASIGGGSPPADVATTAGALHSEYVNNNKEDITAKTATEFSGTAGVGAVNIAIAVAALVVAAVSVAAVRKRQKSDRAHETPHKRHNSIRNLNCMELGTPL